MKIPITNTTHGVILIAIAIATFQDLVCVAHHPPRFDKLNDQAEELLRKFK